MTLDLHPDLHVAKALVDRRTVLGAACVGCAALLTACGSSSGSSASSSDGASAATTTDPATSSAAATDPATSAPAASGAKGLAVLADIKVGEAVAVKANGKNILITRTGDATAAAFSAICTHQGCTVEPDGTELACPCHGSTFKASDGSVVHGPASRGLASVAVTVTDGSVFLS